MTILATGAGAPRDRPWTTEARAMLGLAWPMIMTNLAQTAMQTTDVMMMGRLGSAALASGTLGANLYFSPMIFGLGIILAVSPMVAVELGRNRHSVRDVRRTVRQGFWIAALVCLPIWLFLWNAEVVLVGMGQDPALSADAAAYLRAMQWATLPYYLYIVLRSFISALERPGWALAGVDDPAGRDAHDAPLGGAGAERPERALGGGDGPAEHHVLVVVVEDPETGQVELRVDHDVALPRQVVDVGLIGLGVGQREAVQVHHHGRRGTVAQRRGHPPPHLGAVVRAARLEPGGARAHVAGGRPVARGLTARRRGRPGR